MKILFDQGTPVPLRRALAEHTVSTTYEQGWATITNGQLLACAEDAGYDLLITTDQNLRYQQNLTTRRIAIVCGKPYQSVKSLPAPPAAEAQR